MTFRSRLGIGAALLVGVSHLVLAQPAPEAAAMPAQTAEDPLVPADDATHIVRLAGPDDDAGAPAGAAWLLADEQNHTLRWTIEYADATGVTAARILCPPAEGAAAPADAGTTEPALAGRIELAPEDGAPAAANDDDDEDGLEGLVDVIDLYEGAAPPNFDSPLEGEAGVEEAVFDHIIEGVCFLVLDAAGEGAGGGAAAPPAGAAAPAGAAPGGGAGAPGANAPAGGGGAPPAGAAAGGAGAGAVGGAAAAGGAAGGAAGAAVDVAALVREGEPLYRSNCAACHGAEGQGGAGPALAGYARLEAVGTVATQIVHGGAYMPAFGNLSDDQIAAIATYIRNSWGNSFGPVTPADVAAVR